MFLLLYKETCSVKFLGKYHTKEHTLSLYTSMIELCNMLLNCRKDEFVKKSFQFGCDGTNFKTCLTLVSYIFQGIKGGGYLDIWELTLTQFG